MSDFGLMVTVREGDDSGPPIPNALVTGTLMSTTTDSHGSAVIEGLYLSVEADGYVPYLQQPYLRPSLQAPITVSLRRR